MKKITLSLLIIIMSFALHAQFDYGCDGTRYVNDVFSEISNDSYIFGRNVRPNGDSIDLVMDVFYPANDQADARPLIILAHSGAFIGGDRSEMYARCEEYAKMGYVSATIDYRLLDIFDGIPDSIGSMDIAVKASHDMKAAIRWFKHSANTDNIYNIDPNMFFIGGYSAGAITALICGVLDENEIDQPFILDILQSNGGLEGNTGDPAHLIYDIEVQGILNLSGAVYDTSWITTEDPTIYSMHGTNDEIVGYDYQFATVFGIQLIPLHGSSNIFQHTENLGVTGYLQSVEGGGHTDIYVDPQFSSDLQTFVGVTDTIQAEIICGTLVNSAELDMPEISISPNPVNNSFQVNNISSATPFRIYNYNGQVVQESILSEEGWIDVSELSSGIYTIQFSSERIISSKSFIIQK